MIDSLSSKYCFGRLLKFLRPYMSFIMLALAFSLVQIGATLLAPIVIGRAVDALVGQGIVDFDAVFVNIVYLLGCIACVMLFQWLSTLATNHASYLTISDIRVAAFNKLNRVPLSYIDRNSHGDLMSRIVNDSDLVSEGLIAGFTNIFTGIITIVGTIGFMFALNYKIALIVVLITPLSIVVSFFVARLSRDRFQKQASMRGKLFGLVEEMLGGQKTVKAFGYENTALQRFDEMNVVLRRESTLAMFFSSLSNPTSRFINSIVFAAVTAAGASMVIATPEAFTVGALAGFLSYASQYTKPFNEVTAVLAELQSSMASLRRIVEVLDADEEKGEDTLPVLEDCNGDVRADKVYFAYDKSRPLIQNFNLDVKKGMRIAIVGPTGCGKTTLINLLMRFYDPDSGRILVSGVDTTSVTRASLRANYGMILQESWLFKGTIRENIAYGKEDATDDEIIQAAKNAHIHRFIMRQDQGYDTMITEDGANLSQGQRQLLTIARIMLTRPPMLILDEATSNIDTRTEKRIQQAFKTMMQGRTCFIIAHRLSTIQDADLILVMKDGNIIETGTHTQLLSTQGFYSTLFNSQFTTLD